MWSLKNHKVLQLVTNVCAGLCVVQLCVFFFFACAVVKRCVSSVARGMVGKSWLTGNCTLTEYLLINETILLHRSHEM